MAPRFFHYPGSAPRTALAFSRVTGEVPEDPIQGADLSACLLAVLLSDFDGCGGEPGTRPFIAAAVGLAGSDEEYIPDAPAARLLAWAGILCARAIAAAPGSGTGAGTKPPGVERERSEIRCGGEVFEFCRMAKAGLSPHRVMIAGLLSPPGQADPMDERAVEAMRTLLDFTHGWVATLPAPRIDASVERALESASASLWLTSSMRSELALILHAIHERTGALPGDVLLRPSIQRILGSGLSPKAKGKEIIKELKDTQGGVAR